MQKWEYLDIWVELDSREVKKINGLKVKNVQMDQYLNKIGLEGWEMIASGGQFANVLFFKRPLEPKS